MLAAALLGRLANSQLHSALDDKTLASTLSRR
jgi:hypothetical protein